MAVADPVLERDAPRPAAALRGRARIGGERFDARARPRQCAVAGEPRAPVDPRHAPRCPKAQRAEARTVDDELARNLGARGQIGSASGRDRAGPSAYITGAAGNLKKKKTTNQE